MNLSVLGVPLRCPCRAELVEALFLSSTTFVAMAVPMTAGEIPWSETLIWGAGIAVGGGISAFGVDVRRYGARALVVLLSAMIVVMGMVRFVVLIQG